MKKSLSLAGALMVLTVLVVSGCETTKGAGRDIEAAGSGIQNVANDVQH
jgi:predicted small secreted protein